MTSIIAGNLCEGHIPVAELCSPLQLSNERLGAVRQVRMVRRSSSRPTGLGSAVAMEITMPTSQSWFAVEIVAECCLPSRRRSLSSAARSGMNCASDAKAARRRSWVRLWRSGLTGYEAVFASLLYARAKGGGTWQLPGELQQDQESPKLLICILDGCRHLGIWGLV